MLVSEVVMTPDQMSRNRHVVVSRAGIQTHERTQQEPRRERGSETRAGNASPHCPMRVAITCTRCQGLHGQCGLGWGARAPLPAASRLVRSSGHASNLAAYEAIHSSGMWHFRCTDLPPMRVGQLRQAWWIQGATIAVVLLALATGFCLFDQEEDGAGGHMTPPDLCLAMLAASLSVMPLARLLATGWTVSLPVAVPSTVALHIPDPPPRPARSFRP